MISRIAALFKSVDILLLISVVILSSFGFAALYSIGLGKDPQDFFYVQKQMTVFGICFVFLLVLAFLNYRVYRNFAIPLFILSCILLLIVLFFGRTVRGTKGWFFLGGLGFQPAELAKVALTLVLARYFSNYTRQVSQFRHIVISGIIALIPIVLVLAQPALGSSVVLFSIWLGMILMSGIPKRYIAFLVGAIVITSAVMWLFVLKDFQKDRVINFISPHSDVKGGGYHVRQALIAIGAGQAFGQGFGNGSQSHLKFVPENQTDFIFSVIAEEMGLLGIGIVLAFWVLFFHRLMAIMRSVRDDFALYTLVGLSVMFFVQTAMNIGGNLGVLPLAGLPLPLISYGGSAQMIALFAIGIAQSIRTHSV